MTGVVPRFTETPGAVRHPGPRLGEHTADVLREVAGLSDEALAELRAAGILGDIS